MHSVFIKKSTILIFLSFFAFLFACVRRENIQGKGVPFLQGKWEENENSTHKNQLNYTKHIFTFTCDSFYLAQTTHAKVNYYPDSCYQNGLAKEYAKGTYVLRKDTLILLGVYTKANYKQKISGCFSIGQYLQSFLIQNKNNNVVEFKNLNNYQTSLFTCKQKISCKPKKID